MREALAAAPFTSRSPLSALRSQCRPGFDADFIVLDANPLDAITNTRRIARVVLNGIEIDRASLRSKLQ